MPDDITGSYSSTFVRTWAEAVLREVERVRDVRKKEARDSRNYERMEDWSPDEDDLQRNFRSVWAEEHTLVWAAHQLEQWSQRLARERGEDPPEADPVLKRARDALEHLDDAVFEGFYAVPGDVPNENASKRQIKRESNRALRALPDSRLMIAVGTDLAFGLIDPTELEGRALAIVRRIEDELDQDAIARYIDMLDE